MISDTARRPGLRVPIDIGIGSVVVMLPGFGLPPTLYRRPAELLALRCRVVVPELYRVARGWSDGEVAARLSRTIEALDTERVTMIAHSFAGGLQLDYAARWPGRVEELVFCDTLAMSREWRLAREASRYPFRLLRMATPAVAIAFGATALSHPVDLIEAGWWGFTSQRVDASKLIASRAIPTHVLWASRDSLLSRDDGRAFAQDLGASFEVARVPGGRPIDHDWMYRHPTVFVQYVEGLGLAALR
jgi:pimeloyl-ACP methyl ester carboxylesterase